MIPAPYFPGIIAFLVCAALLPAVKAIARFFSLYDQPGPIKIHQGRIPRLGGIAMVAGLLAGSVPLLPNVPLKELPLLVFTVVWAVGLVDDVTSLSSSLRLCAHLMAGAALWFAGWRLQWFHPAQLDLVATCVFVALVINSMNLLDGMDGLAVGTAAIISVGFMAASVKDASVLGFVIAAGLLGASCGMLLVNAPPATMFMGDSGSTLVGVVLAFLSLNWITAQHSIGGFALPLIFLAVPLADLLLAILRRTRAHASLFAGDRRHFYDLLLQRGWTVRRVLGAALFVTAVLVGVGLASSRGAFAQTIAASMVAVAAAVAAYFLGSLGAEPEVVQAGRKGSALVSTFERVKSTPLSSGDGDVIL